MSYKHAETKYRLNELIQEMNYFEISGAAVWSNVGKDYSYVRGNEELIKIADDNIFPVFTIVPHLEYEINNGKNYLDYLVKSGAKALQMHPRSLNHAFIPFYLKNVAEFMIIHHIPLFIDINEIEIVYLENVLREFSELNIVLLNTSWRDNRLIFPLLDKYKNLYIELSSNQANDILEILKKNFGLANILYGSQFPYKTIGASKASIEYANIEEYEKDMVAYQNSCKLLNINPERLKRYEKIDSEMDSIAQRVDKGEKLDDILIIDAHAHVVDYRDESVSYQLMFHTNEDYILEKMDRIGIDKTVILASWEGITTNAIEANKTALRIKKDIRIDLRFFHHIILIT